MKKYRVKYICSNCGFESLKWLGKCPSCATWNSFSEEILETNEKTVRKKEKSGTSSFNINEIESSPESHRTTNSTELDRVLGGGLVAGSVVLIGGDPGIGKSTLVLQSLGKVGYKSLYISGEESLRQIKMRAERLQVVSEALFLMAETNLENILNEIDLRTPEVVVIDSIQTIQTDLLQNSAGTVTQIRECTARLIEKAKKDGFSVLIIGHVTKDGTLAGPKVLEHMVDTVLQFEGDPNHNYRIIRAAKNRFGSTNEIGIFDMRDSGLIEITNPSEIFLSNSSSKVNGSCVTATMEGLRPLLVEIQTLVTPSHFGNPQRVCDGFDYRRLSILLAVLEKRVDLRFSTTNVFLNVAGGLNIYETAADLAICIALATGLTDKLLERNLVAIGEVGLGGELRQVKFLEKRLSEAARLGFKTALIPPTNEPLPDIDNMEVIRFPNLRDTLHFVMNM
ncbi:MAG: DNA repair protein RadA [Ignavibacteriaceae bacterium]|nr:DNA repair protein RadA [Ignavibacteriaceae bacterium]